MNLNDYLEGVTKDNNVIIMTLEEFIKEETLKND
jgi:hypothetical protein